MTRGSARGSAGESSSNSIAVGTDWDETGDHTPVYAVVSAVAAASDTDPLDLPALNDAVDPDALNALFASRRESTVRRITFRYAGYEVTVREDGDIRVSNVRGV